MLSPPQCASFNICLVTPQFPAPPFSDTPPYTLLQLLKVSNPDNLVPVTLLHSVDINLRSSQSHSGPPVPVPRHWTPPRKSPSLLPAPPPTPVLFLSLAGTHFFTQKNTVWSDPQPPSAFLSPTLPLPRPSRPGFLRTPFVNSPGIERLWETLGHLFLGVLGGRILKAFYSAADGPIRTKDFRERL